MLGDSLFTWGFWEKPLQGVVTAILIAAVVAGGKAVRPLLRRVWTAGKAPGVRLEISGVLVQLLFALIVVWEGLQVHRSTRNVERFSNWAMFVFSIWLHLLHNLSLDAIYRVKRMRNSTFTQPNDAALSILDPSPAAAKWRYTLLVLELFLGTFFALIMSH
jgi:hypothetical protein